MTEYTYNQTIEYIDGTYDENFNKAKKWAFEHNTTFEEDMEARDLPKRYFVIGKEPEPMTEPSEEEKKISVSVLCSQYINDISWRVERYNTQKAINVETSDSEEMYLYILKYMEYCREYDDQDNNWWEQNPLDFDTWIETFSKK